MKLEYINILGNEEFTIKEKGNTDNLVGMVLTNKHNTNPVYVDIYFWETSLQGPLFVYPDSGEVLRTEYNPNNWDDQNVKSMHYFMKNVAIEKGNTLTLDSNDLSSYDPVNYSLAIKLSDPDSNIDLTIKHTLIDKANRRSILKQNTSESEARIQPTSQTISTNY